MDALVGFAIVLAVLGAGVLVARGLKQGLREEGSSESDDAASGLSSQDWLLYQMMSDPQTQTTSSSPNPCDMSLSSVRPSTGAPAPVHRMPPLADAPQTMRVHPAILDVVMVGKAAATRLTKVLRK